MDSDKSREQPVGNIHSAVLSDIATHLSEISLRSGKVVEWDSEKEIITDKDLRKYMHRDMRDPWKLV